MPRPTPPPPKYQQKFSLKKIGTGGFFTGESKVSRRSGLAGALRAFKGAGKYSFAQNLSGKDIKTFQGVIGKHLAKLPAHTTTLPRQTKIHIKEELEKLRIEGKISASDKTDFGKLLDAMSAGGQASGATPAQQKTAIKVEAAKANRLRAYRIQEQDEEREVFEKQSDKPAAATKKSGVLASRQPLRTPDSQVKSGTPQTSKDLGQDFDEVVHQIEREDIRQGVEAGRTKKKEQFPPSTKNLPDIDIG